MSDFTPRANLRLPGGGSTGTILPDEQVDIDVLNDNFRKIDALLGARNIPSASSYSGSMDGDLVYARDTEFLHMFSTTAGGLITPRLPGARQYSGTAAERVAFAVQAKNGDLWRDTDNIGVIWAYKAGSPGAWEYTGNVLRGTRAAMDQLVTDGKAVVGMRCYCTDDNSDYVYRGAAWRRRITYEAIITPPITGGGTTSGWTYGGTGSFTFPAGLFPSAPTVELFPYGVGFYSCSLSSVTKDGFNAATARLGAAPDASARISVKAWLDI